MLDLLIEGDHRKCRKFWAEKMPGFPQPASDEEAEIVMHQARTMSLIPTELRLWSYKWLIERSLPSQLPENLKAKAEQLKPKQVKAVGISLTTDIPALGPAVETIRKSMEDAVLDMLSGNDELPSSDIVRARLDEVYDQTSKRLFGRTDKWQ